MEPIKEIQQEVSNELSNSMELHLVGNSEYSVRNLPRYLNSLAFLKHLNNFKTRSNFRKCSIISNNKTSCKKVTLIRATGGRKARPLGLRMGSRSRREGSDWARALRVEGGG